VIQFGTVLAYGEEGYEFGCLFEKGAEYSLHLGRRGLLLFLIIQGETGIVLGGDWDEKLFICGEHFIDRVRLLFDFH
jgi:hypothetical protein